MNKLDKRCYVDHRLFEMEQAGTVAIYFMYNDDSVDVLYTTAGTNKIINVTVDELFLKFRAEERSERIRKLF